MKIVPLLLLTLGAYGNCIAEAIGKSALNSSLALHCDRNGQCNDKEI